MLRVLAHLVCTLPWLRQSASGTKAEHLSLLPNARAWTVLHAKSNSSKVYRSAFLTTNESEGVRMHVGTLRKRKRTADVSERRHFGGTTGIRHETKHRAVLRLARPHTQRVHLYSSAGVLCVAWLRGEQNAQRVQRLSPVLSSAVVSILVFTLLTFRKRVFCVDLFVRISTPYALYMHKAPRLVHRQLWLSTHSHGMSIASIVLCWRQHQDIEPSQMGGMYSYLL